MLSVVDDRKVLFIFVGFIFKLQAKRMKLEEASAKADQQYHDITIIAERQVSIKGNFKQSKILYP